MSKRDLVKRIDNQSPVIGGEMVVVASVTQVQHLTISGPYSGDFQIVDNGRLIVGQDPDAGARVIVSNRGHFGYSAAGTNTFSLWTATSPNGDNTPGDLHIGNLAANFLLYDHSEGTLGLYTPAGAGVLLSNDGSARFGHADGGHMLWDSASESLKIKSGTAVVSEIDSLGNASFTGVITATGGRITGDMQVDARLRAGDVDGPAVYIGKLVDEDGAAYAGQIMVTDTENVPWFNVRTGSDGTGYLHVGRPGDYPNRLTLEVTSNDATLTFDGTAYLRGGAVMGDLTVSHGSIIAGGGNVIVDNTGIRIRLDETSATSISRRYRMVTQGDEALSWMGGYYTSGVSSLIARSDSTIRNNVASYQADSTGTHTAEANIAALQDATQAYVSVSIDAGGASLARIEADTVSVNSDGICIEDSQTPASAGATGTAGTIAWDANYLYVCKATNSWGRIALAW